MLFSGFVKKQQTTVGRVHFLPPLRKIRTLPALCKAVLVFDCGVFAKKIQKMKKMWTT